MTLSRRLRFWFSAYHEAYVQPRTPYNPLHHYNEEMKNFLNLCEQKPILRQDAKLIDVRSLNCAIAYTTATIPVRLSLGGCLFNFNVLKNLPNFDSEYGFIDPITYEKRYKRDILPDFETRLKIIELINERKKQISHERYIFPFTPLPLNSHPVFFPVEIFARMGQIEQCIDAYMQTRDIKFISLNRIIFKLFPKAESDDIYIIQRLLCQALRLPKRFLFESIDQLSENQLKVVCRELARTPLSINRFALAELPPKFVPSRC